nr:MAG TPA: hypothetical protein [Caudoviricetes sp.]
MIQAKNKLSHSYIDKFLFPSPTYWTVKLIIP